MRLATARDELEPLRDPRITGPDDPRLTVLVLSRVITGLGELPMVTMHEIEGVINFGNQEEFDALVQAQAATRLVGDQSAPAAAPPAVESEVTAPREAEPAPEARPGLRHAVEELPRKSG
jgi:hypothetical protein